MAAQTPISYKDPAWDKAEAEASKVTGVPAEVIRAIRTAGEQSNSDQVSPKGAKGVYQFTPATEKLFAKKYGVSAYSNNPVEQATAAAYHLKESYARTKDWALAAAGYNAGPAGEKNPRFTQETSKYYDRVKEALGQPPAAGEPAATASTKRGAPTWDEFMGGTAQLHAGGADLADPQPKYPSLVAGAGLGYANRDQAVTQTQAAQGLHAEQVAEQTKVDTQSFGLGGLAAALLTGKAADRGTVMGAFYSTTMAPYFSFLDKVGAQPDPEYMHRVSADAGVAFEGVENPSRDEQEDLLGARSADERRAVVARIHTNRDDAKVIGREGTWTKLGGGLIASGLDPFTYVTGYGAAKAFYVAGRGAMVLASQGRRAAAISSSIAENALGNVAYQGVLQAVGEHKSISDYGLAIATGIFPAALSVPGLSRAASKYHADTAAAVLARQEHFLRRAAAQLGEGAEPSAIRKLAAEMEHGDVNQTLAAVRTREHKVVAPDVDDPEFQASLKETPDESQGLPAWPEANRLHNTYEQAAVQYGVTVAIPESGVGLDAKLSHMAKWRKARAHAQALVDRYIPGTRIGLQGSTDGPGAALQLADGSHVVFLENADDLSTLTHEIGHVVFNTLADKLPEDLRLRMRQEVAAWGKRLETDAPRAMRERMGTARLAQLSENSALRKTAEGNLDYAGLEAAARSAGDDPAAYMSYFRSLDEYGAEQLLKHTEDLLATGKLPNAGPLSHMVQIIKSLVDLFRKAKEDGTLSASEAWGEFYERAAKGEFRETGPQGMVDVGAPGFKSAVGNTGEFSGQGLHRMAFTANTDPIDVEFGLTALTGNDVKTRAERKAIRELIRMAKAEMDANPIDKEKTKTIMKNSMFNMATPGLQLALSNHPVAQWASRHLVENTMGGSGRHVTASMRKGQYELEFVGNGNILLDQAYEAWKAQRGTGTAQGLGNDIFKGDMLAQFDREVFLEVHNRKFGNPSSADPNVLKAADAHQAQYERMLQAQKANKTIGWSALPDTAVGYAPNHLSAGRLGDMSNARKETIRQIIEDQLVSERDFDQPFAQKLSGAYLDHARVNANGGHEIPLNVHDGHVPEYIAQAARAAGMTEAEIAAIGARFAAGGASHTKRRLGLDVTKEYTDADGTFTLADIMDTDMRVLLRNQARRVAGEVAVTQQGVMGSPGLKLMERAMQFTADGKVDVEAQRAFQQVSAELLGRPYGEAMPTLAEGAMTANAMASLGQMVIPQLVETTNMATALGIASTVRGIMSLPRLIGEVRTLARGGSVDSILNTVEVPGGEFGMTDYKLVTRFDSPSAMYDTVGRDHLSSIDKLIRMSGRALGKLSFHRIIQAAQTRAAAEQITQKALKYIRDGLESKALADMGIDGALSARMRADLPNIAQFDARGNILSLDMTKATDIEAVEQFITSVHRGTGQIIQRSFVGEVGRWQHNNLGKIVTQFRTFPITAMEKQWGRQRGVHGAARAMGLVVALLPWAVPIYLGKVAINALWRDDPDDYIDQMTTPLALARGVMNYVGLLGLAPDIVDGFTAAPFIGSRIEAALGGEQRNARPGTTGSIIPLVGRADRTLRALQGQGGPQSAVQALPFSNLPYVVPFVNALPTDW